MYQINSYSEFAPVRQSSTLIDDTLPMNGMDIYFNISAVWPAGYHNREKEIRKSTDDASNDVVHGKTTCMTTSGNNLPFTLANSLDSTFPNALDSTLPNTLASTLSNGSSSLLTNDSDDTLWTTALDTSFKNDEESRTCDKEIRNERYHTVLNFTLPHNEAGTLEQLKLDASLDDTLLNETLPMDEMSFEDTLEMEP